MPRTKSTGTGRARGTKRPTKKQAAKVGKVMDEYRQGKLHSGSKKGPAVKSRKQAIAIALNESGQSNKKKTVTKKKTAVRKTRK